LQRGENHRESCNARSQNSPRQKPSRFDATNLRTLSIFNLFFSLLYSTTFGCKPRVATQAINLSAPSQIPLIFRCTVKTKPRFGECYTCFGYETKTGVVRIWLFFKIGLCSAISFKRSRRELSIDVAEHRPMLKNYQNTPRFSFIPKTGMAFPKTGVLFLLCGRRLPPRSGISVTVERGTSHK